MNQPQTEAAETVFLTIIGGGLAGALLACRFAMRFPSRKVAVIERGSRIGGGQENRSWSWHAKDLSESQAAWMDRFVSHRWDRQQVRFSNGVRVLEHGYRNIQAQDFHQKVLDEVGAGIFAFGETVRKISERPKSDDGRRFIIETNQRTLSSEFVVDARGGYLSRPLGYQKFIGAYVSHQKSQGSRSNFATDIPTIMDAEMPQIDGYKFFYHLPFSSECSLIEETCYGDSPELWDRDGSKERILAYAVARGLKDPQIVSLETGALPIPGYGQYSDATHENERRTPLQIARRQFAEEFSLDYDTSVSDGLVIAGLRAGLFHSTTGYSLPVAVAFAEKLCELFDDVSDDPSVQAKKTVSLAIAEWTEQHWRQGLFFRRLNNMLFLAAQPAERRKIFELFYTRSDQVVENFYKGYLTVKDRMTILSGKPPVNIVKGLKAFRTPWKDIGGSPHAATNDQRKRNFQHSLNPGDREELSGRH